MMPQRQAEMAVIVDHLTAGGHRAQRHAGFVELGRSPPSRAAAAAKSGRGSSASALMAQSASRRARPKAGRKASASASSTRAAAARRAAPEIVDRGERLVGPGRDDRGGMGIGEPRTMRNPSRTAKLPVGRSAPACSPSGRRWRRPGGPRPHGAVRRARSGRARRSPSAEN